MNEKSKVWTEEQTINYEIAVEMISELKAILRRQSRVIDDEKKIAAYKKRASELTDEGRSFGGFDDDLVADVIKTYSKLVREYWDIGGTEEQIAEKGLPQQYIDTKVEYAKYKK